PPHRWRQPTRTERHTMTPKVPTAFGTFRVGCGAASDPRSDPRETWRMRVSEAADAFTAHAQQVRRLSSATVRAYRGDLRDLSEALADPALSDVDLESL